MSSEQFSMQDKRNATVRDQDYLSGLQAYFEASSGTHVDKLRNFSKFVPRQDLARFLARQEIFGRILDVHGHIIEAGVFMGGGLMTWAQLSAIYEPVNHTRRIIGFDTFEGFPSVSDQDRGDNVDYACQGGLRSQAEGELREAIRLFDLNRDIGHIPRIELVRGDAQESVPTYLKNNPHLVVALLYLDFDLYEPTKAALETFLPRMPKGAVIAFDELNQAAWPGETLAALEVVGLRNLRLRRFAYQPQISYAVLE